MSVDETLRQAVEEAKETSDYSKIRDRLWARIATDLTLEGDFKEALDFCTRSGIREEDLYEGHDGRSVALESSEENFSSLIGALRTNFSKERLDAVGRMGRALHPRQDAGSVPGAAEQTNSSKTTHRKVLKAGGQESSKEDGGSGRLGWLLAAAILIVATAILLKKL